MARVLIIEDDQWLGDSYGRILTDGGYEVDRAADADAAIDLIDLQLPDVILLDMLLTRTTGMALLHELQSHTDLASIPIVVVSTLASRMKLSELESYGVRGLLDKDTVTPRQMTRAVKEAMV